MLSIIIPVHNSEESLQRCVESIQNNNFKDIEIILVENGSLDFSWKLCQELSLKDDRIKTFQSDKGVSKARNKGLEYAEGEYITFVDADDYISPYMYSSMMEIFYNNECDIVYCDYMKSNNKQFDFEIPKGETKIITKDDFYYHMFLKDSERYGSVCNKIFKSKVIKDGNLRFNESLGYTEDKLFNIYAVYNSNNIYYIDEKFYVYFQDNQDAATKSNDMYNRMGMVYCLVEAKQLFANDKRYYEYANANLLENADFRYKRCKEEKVYDLLGVLKPVIKESTKILVHSKRIPLKDKIKRLTMHYMPHLFKLIVRIV